MHNHLANRTTQMSAATPEQHSRTCHYQSYRLSLNLASQAWPSVSRESQLADGFQSPMADSASFEWR